MISPSQLLVRIAAIRRPGLRFGALWMVCAVLFALAWTASYLLLPEGILRGTFPVADAPLETTLPIWTFLRIFAYNLLVAGGLVVVGNTIRVNGTPLGYLIVLYHSILFGLFLGTNSFAHPRSGPVSPSLVAALTSSGVYEITAYIAFAAGTTPLVLWTQTRWLTLRTDRVQSIADASLRRAEWALLVGGVTILTLANLVEAASIGSSLP